tara:strand:+ start:4896 stop:6206 length:1311 start_codon:yes stop_codon:yes gene_type:complete
MTMKNEPAAFMVGLDEVREWEKNPRINEEAVEKVAASIKRFGFGAPVVARKECGTLIAGHTRLKAARLLGLERIPCRYLDISMKEAEALALADNKLGEIAVWEDNMLAALLADLSEEEAVSLGFNEDELEDLLGNVENNYVDLKGSLFDDFVIPPFSIFDSRQGYWQDKKKIWMSLINDKGESRKNTGMMLGKSIDLMLPTVSILDPVLAEIICKWFASKNYNVFDPFAGDTVFGYVAATLGLKFTGTELRKEQVEINNERTKNLDANYICSDALNAENYIQKNSVDLIFSCPPYADLESYSDLPNDISNMTHNDFFIVYKKVLMKTFDFLKENRFAVIVTSEVRNKDGEYISLVGKTISFMKDAGYKYWNDIILINCAGTAPMRARGYMNASRKVTRIHQNVLVFYKGEPKNIKKEYDQIISKYYLEELNESSNL